MKTILEFLTKQKITGNKLEPMRHLDDYNKIFDDLCSSRNDMQYVYLNFKVETILDYIEQVYSDCDQIDGFKLFVEDYYKNGYLAHVYADPNSYADSFLSKGLIQEIDKDIKKFKKSEDVNKVKSCFGRFFPLLFKLYMYCVIEIDKQYGLVK